LKRTFWFFTKTLCTNKNHSYKHNEQINSQNIDNSECFGVKNQNVRFNENLGRFKLSLKFVLFIHNFYFTEIHVIQVNSGF
jgi:hypothetical protein